MTATTRRKPFQSKAATPASVLYLIIGKTLYGVRPVRLDDPGDRKAFRLNKSDGTLYDVAQTGLETRCDCPDYVFRRDGLDPEGCKHVKALVAQGLIGRTPVRPR